MRSLLLALTLLTASARTAHADDAASVPVRDRGDLFPGAGHPTVAAATGLPFLGIGEVGVGITNGIAVSAVAGITPSVWTVGVRPRFRVGTSERTSLMLVAPILYYPQASAPGPLNVGRSSWLLTRVELFFDGALGERWHLAGGMGLIAAGSTEALKSLFAGDTFKMPAYDGNPTVQRGFAGGIWNTVATRSTYAFDDQTHLFAEGSVVLAGVLPASGVGGPPIVVNVGLQRSF